MRDFADLLCKDDPADNAPSILDRMLDLLSAAHCALMDADGNNAERIANEVATVLEILNACVVRAYAGVDALQREAKRGVWRDKPATGEEG
ncbi:hypothetical protein LO749_00915 [Paracoccus denitrificans]|uniref:hypothetical protein n=1 Tax=Paracoccus denitrificans TaxID=266 RepID=UPI001E51DC59|nr:hypothetical protein [Paracoccus denitrificans]UFS65162.1 hypothetical protein LO749_00915 [Paracoccus denitrificans]